MGSLFYPDASVCLDRWRAFDLDGYRPRACSQTGCTEIREAFWDQATIEAPEKITDSFPLAAQVAKGPDIVIWAHDKIGEWAEGGLIAPIEFSDALAHKFFPKALQAVLHQNRSWGYPIALETVTLIYNRKLSTVLLRRSFLN